MLKFVTLDFWNTIATPNPAFKKARNEYLHQNSTLSLETVGKIYTETKAELDEMAETCGDAYSTMGCVGMLLEKINPSLCEHEEDAAYQRVIKINRQIQQLALEFPPTITNELIHSISDLKAKGFGVGIISNTNFISGATIRQICIGCACKFDTYSFSDELASSKPDPHIFMHNMHQSGATEEELIHIGDNTICDGGAEDLGIKTVIVKNPTDTIFALQALL